MISVVDRFLDVPGGRIFSRTWVHEKSTRSPLILLHDSLGSIDLWGSFPSALAEATQRTVIAYDRLGFGRSSPRVEPPSIRFIFEEAEIYFPALKRELGFREFVLFGHSVGGTMAVIIAGHFPNECQAVITEAAQAFVENRTIEGIQLAKEKFKNPQAIEKLKKLHGEKTQWVLDAWIETWLSPAFATWSLAADLPNVKCPLLAIHGEEDEYGSEKFPEMLTRLTGGKSQMELIKDCGHIPHRERREVVLALVSTFLA